MHRKTETAVPCFFWAALGAVALLLAYAAFLGTYWLVCHTPGLALCLLAVLCFALARHWDCRTWAEAARERSHQVGHEMAIEHGLTAQAMDTAIELRRERPPVLSWPTRAALFEMALEDADEVTLG